VRKYRDWKYILLYCTSKDEKTNILDPLKVLYTCLFKRKCGTIMTDRNPKI